MSVPLHRRMFEQAGELRGSIVAADDVDDVAVGPERAVQPRQDSCEDPETVDRGDSLEMTE